MARGLQVSVFTFVRILLKRVMLQRCVMYVLVLTRIWYVVLILWSSLVEGGFHVCTIF